MAGWNMRFAALVAALSPCVAAADGGVIASALAEAKPILDARVRYEMVEQTPLPQDANAETLRLRAGVETGKAWNTSLLVEGEIVSGLGGDYREDGSRQRDLAYPVVADPDSQEINRLQLVNTSLSGTTLTLGRQRIVLDDQRFVGNSAWRQNEQTFDAVRIVNKSVPGLTLDATYLDQVNRTFGRDSPQGRYRGDGMLGNVAYQFPFGKLAGFAYLLDLDSMTTLPAALNPVRVSTETRGGRFSGERPLSKLKVNYAASYARQSDYGDNPLNFNLDYYSLELAGTYRQYTVTFGQEVMQGNGTVGFATPLATMHRFHGWADKFLATPVNGIDDRYASVSYQAKGVAMLDTVSAIVTYRDLRSERLAIDLGAEVDLLLQAKYQRFVASLKYVRYEANEGQTPAAYQDTRKLWAQLEYVW